MFGNFFALQIIVQKVELKNVVFKNRQDILVGKFLHNAHIAFVEGGSKNIALVGKTFQKVSRSGTAVPNVIIVLPVFA